MWRANLDRFGAAGIQRLVDGEPYVIRRDDVRRIWTPRQSYWNAMGGLVLPVTGISMVTGGLICRGHETCVERYAASVAGLGIGLGVLNVFTKNRHALVYDAGKSSSSTAAAIYPAFGQHKAALQMAIHF